MYIFYSLCIIFGIATHRIAKSTFIDDETPSHKRITQRYRDGANLTLVMSDEFNINDRSFEPGQDTLFEARNIPDPTNEALEFCEMR